MGGVVVESGRFDWANGRFPRMTEPVASYGGLRFWDNFGEYGFCTQLRVEQLRDFGTCLAPLNAFLLLQGLETLPLRMDAHVANALGLAEHLAGHPAVAWVSYAGLSSSPYHALARRYLPRGPGRGVRLRGQGRAGRRPGVHRSRRAGQPPGQHRRHPHPGDPPGLHDPSAAFRRGAGWPRASGPTWSGSRSASRTSTTSSGTSTGR